MKYVRLTYIDAKTKKPLYEEPAKNGIILPDGVIPTFDIESTRTKQAPTVYGFVGGDEVELPSFISEIPEEVFYDLFKLELKERARNKRFAVETGGMAVGDVRIGTSIEDQNRVSNMATSLTLDTGMESVDFEYSPGNWINIPRNQGFSIGVALARHVQGCFSWCKSVHDLIDELDLNIDTLESVFPILEEINSFGQTPQETPVEEPPVPEDIPEDGE